MKEVIVMEVLIEVVVLIEVAVIIEVVVLIEVAVIIEVQALVEAPLARSPISHHTIGNACSSVILAPSKANESMNHWGIDWLAEPVEVLAEMKVTFSDRISRTLTRVALAVPLLVTVTV